MNTEIQKIQDSLAAPFEPSEVKHKPAMVKGNRALALHYVDARTIMERLDAVVGVAGWRDEYEFLPDGSCVCKLSILFGEVWITKMDVWPATKNLQLALAFGPFPFDNWSMQEAKYSTYELRLRAIQALQDGMPVFQVCQAYQVDRTTLYRWRIRAGARIARIAPHPR